MSMAKSVAEPDLLLRNGSLHALNEYSQRAEAATHLQEQLVTWEAR